MLGAYYQDSEATAMKLISDSDDVILNYFDFVFFVIGLSRLVRLRFRLHL